MMSLLVFKERLKEFYARFDIYITSVIKFLFSFFTFYMMNKNIGFMSKLMNPLIPVILALVCSFLPYGAIAFLAAVYMVLHLSGISFEITLVMAVAILVVALLYYGFHPGDSYYLLLTPLFFFLRIPYAIPLIVGLSGSVTAVIPVSFGVFVYFTMIYVKQNAGVLTNEISADMLQKFSQVVKSMFANKLMVVMMIACAIAIIVVYVIHNLSVDYAWIIAIVAGTVAQLVVIFVGDITSDVAVSVMSMVFGVAGSILVAAVYTFFVFSVDYSRTEYVQFEDDDYYYYVKAVPKMTVSAPDVKVQKINARKKPPR